MLVLDCSGSMQSAIDDLKAVSISLLTQLDLNFAHAAVVSRVASLDASSLIQVDSLSANKDRLVWQGFANIAMDYLQHTGQVAYLRGMLDRWKG